MMFTFMQLREDQVFHSGYKGLLTLGAWLVLVLPLSGCSSSHTEYVVDYTHGNDSTAEGSRERPCQTEAQCQTLAERDGVQSYWMVYQ
ncbi:MAG: hypothetical protein IPM58_03100 [Nitrospira sp.]|nr:hypothetical protein [Nitrospira sp.]